MQNLEADSPVRKKMHRLYREGAPEQFIDWIEETQESCDNGLPGASRDVEAMWMQKTSGSISEFVSWLKVEMNPGGTRGSRVPGGSVGVCDRASNK